MYIYKAKLINVVDGDTVDLEIDLGFSITVRERFRLNHIDTPERGTPGAAEATALVKEYLESRELVVSTEKGKDKYGRYLATIAPRGYAESINELLLAKKLAKPYEGGKKE
jgi:micrococcal nuclease